MTASELKTKFLKFFEEKGHSIIPSASLIPEHDPTVLFTTAGMHPLIPYLLGQPHPEGKRLVNVQRCLRTDDIEEIGDAWHLTFFEMLGNWSLGYTDQTYIKTQKQENKKRAYWKREAIEFAYQFLTDKAWLGIDPKKISVSIFEGDEDAERDDESREIWMEVGIRPEKIYFYGKRENWWGPAGEVGPCGPDTEIFYDTEKPHNPRYGPDCHPNCGCGRFSEIWNIVFMEYIKKSKSRSQKSKVKEYEFVPLEKKNIDTGMGLERTLAVLQGKESVYETELFWPIIKLIENSALYALRGKNYAAHPESYRIIADHLRAACFLLADGVVPSNVDQGYVLRRLIRRSIRHAKLLGVAKKENLTQKVAKAIVENYKKDWPHLVKNKKKIFDELQKEEDRFEKTLNRGLTLFEKMSADKVISGKEAFDLFQTYGFPLEMTCELAKERGIKVDKAGFRKAYTLHQKLSRAGAEKKFKGGLAEHTKETIKLHTATHLLHQALRDVLGSHVRQAGSNITSERLRFDFTHPEKVTTKQLQEIEKIVNEKIKKGLPVTFKIMDYKKAQKIGALAFFKERYPEKVKVYFIGDPEKAYSKEICAGPHVGNTKELGKFKIIKEEASSAGVRRIKAVII